MCNARPPKLSSSHSTSLQHELFCWMSLLLHLVQHFLHHHQSLPWWRNSPKPPPAYMWYGCRGTSAGVSLQLVPLCGLTLSVRLHRYAINAQTSVLFLNDLQKLFKSRLQILISKFRKIFCLFTLEKIVSNCSLEINYYTTYTCWLQTTLTI
jgi:hypothetical protein